MKKRSTHRQEHELDLWSSCLFLTGQRLGDQPCDTLHGSTFCAQEVEEQPAPVKGESIQTSYPMTLPTDKAKPRTMRLSCAVGSGDRRKIPG